MTEDGIIELAKNEGFTNVAVIPADKLVFDRELRKYCEENVCGNYGKNYSCPPFCGTPEEMRDRAGKYGRAWIFQTIADVGSWDNRRKLVEVKADHNRRSRNLIQMLREEGVDGLPMLAGPCEACGTCKGFSGEACKYPEEAPSCISAYCMKAELMAEEAGIPYWCGEGVVAYFSLYLV